MKPLKSFPHYLPVERCLPTEPCSSTQEPVAHMLLKPTSGQGSFAGQRRDAAERLLWELAAS